MKRFISSLLAIAMCISFLPATFAAAATDSVVGKVLSLELASRSFNIAYDLDGDGVLTEADEYTTSFSSASKWINAVPTAANAGRDTNAYRRNDSRHNGWYVYPSALGTTSVNHDYLFTYNYTNTEAGNHPWHFTYTNQWMSRSTIGSSFYPAGSDGTAANFTPDVYDYGVMGEYNIYLGARMKSGSFPYFAIQTNIPLPGVYSVDFTTVTPVNLNDSAYVKIYAVPAPADIRSPLAQADFHDVDAYTIGTKSAKVTAENLGEFTFENAGEYYIIFELRDSAFEAGTAGVTMSADSQLYFKNITFTGVKRIGVERTTKTGRTFYTDEMVANARQNIAKGYSWAVEARDAAVAAAEKYIALGADVLWNNVTSQNLPRCYNVGINGDPEKYYCRYCGVNLFEKYANYPWRVDVINNRWKIKCPECSNLFPSNDFASFYELGRTQANGGKFDRITALKAHREMLKSKGLLSTYAKNLTSPGTDGSAQWYAYYGYGVQGGYLYNDLYPNAATEAYSYDASVETVERWGVDDGYGYVTGKKYSGNIAEVHTYIAYYNHFATFFPASVAGFGSSALTALSKAYMYTGEEKYGILGAILLDRLADNYPDYDLSVYCPKYPNNNGGSPGGKALGRIWECLFMTPVAESYDALYPIFENAEVISYLSNKASYYGMTNTKTTAADIRNNIEDGILREIFEACKNSQIHGNFGHHQATLATAAIVLDDSIDTPQMLAWLYAPEKSDYVTYNTGGDINRRLIDVVYRDGANYESPYYNEMGVSEFINAGVALSNYDNEDFDQPSIFEHPKYIKMINSFQSMYVLGRGVQPTGDAFTPVSYNKVPNISPLITAFRYTKDSENEHIREESVKMAQHLYHIIGRGGLSNYHYDIYTQNPEGFANDVKKIVEQYGEYDYNKSSIMTGYGFAYLRAGTSANASFTGITDTTRDFALNFSGHNGHNHHDYLDLQIDAFGIGMTTDLGYPETPDAKDAHRAQWLATPLAHNTVMVNESLPAYPENTMQKPIHFDAQDKKVKVIDAAAPSAYSTLDDFRRTVVMIDVDDEVSYGVDFFRVNGGNDHIWTFSPNSNTDPTVSEVLRGKLVQQNGGSYAGANVAFGPDPTASATNASSGLTYTPGYTWMTDIKKATNPGVYEYTFDYAINDFRGLSRNPAINHRMTIVQLNDFAPTEITLAQGVPQRTTGNDCIGHLERILVRNKGTDIDSLFTTVYAPYYEGNKYLGAVKSTKSGQPTKGEVIAGTPGADDMIKVVKVPIGDNRIDYVVYATNNTVTYRITDAATGYNFDFRGFVGVWSVDLNGNNLYRYLLDGDILGEGEKKISAVDNAIGGTVTAFQTALSFDNWADVTFDRALTDDEISGLVGKMVNFERSAAGNSAFVIEGVTTTDNVHARLDFGSTTTIDGFVDASNEKKGYKYAISNGASFTIPLSYEGVELTEEENNYESAKGKTLSLNIVADSFNMAQDTDKDGVFGSAGDTFGPNTDTTAEKFIPTYTSKQTSGAYYYKLGKSWNIYLNQTSSTEAGNYDYIYTYDYANTSNGNHPWHFTFSNRYVCTGNDEHAATGYVSSTGYYVEASTYHSSRVGSVVNAPYFAVQTNIPYVGTYDVSIAAKAIKECLPTTYLNVYICPAPAIGGIFRNSVFQDNAELKVGKGYLTSIEDGESVGEYTITKPGEYLIVIEVRDDAVEKGQATLSNEMRWWMQNITLTGKAGLVGSDEITAIALEIDKNVLEIDEKAQLSVTETWTVSGEVESDLSDVEFSVEGNAVSVSTDGVVTAVAAGEATITATCGEFTASVGVTVNAPEEPEEPAFIPTFNTSMSASLSLKAIVYLNVQCSFADYGEEDPAELVKSTGLLVWNNATAPANDEDATYETAEKITLGGEWSNNLLNVRTEGIPAKNLGDSLAFRPYYVAADGTYVYGRMIRGYSPKRYCYNTIGKAATSATEKAMLVSLLNYGTAAQLHFGHNTDDLMNSDLTEAQKGSLWTLDLVRSNYSVPAAKEGDLARNSSVVKSRSASLTLAGAIEVNFQMGVAGNIAKVEMLCWDEAAYNAAEVLTEENATLVADMELNGSLYSYTYPGQAARKAFTTIYGCAKVTDTEGNVYYSGVVGYSPERFAYLKTTGTGVAETEKELAQRLAVYGDAARTHFGEE